MSGLRVQVERRHEVLPADLQVHPRRGDGRWAARLFIAKACGIEEIPVLVVVRHWEYVDSR